MPTPPWLSPMAPPQPGSQLAGELLTLEHEKLRTILTEWMVQQRTFFEQHVAQQERMVEAVLGVHSGTLRELGLGPGGEAPGMGDLADLPAQADKKDAAPIEEFVADKGDEKANTDKVEADQPADQAKVEASASQDIEALATQTKDQIGAMETDRSMLDTWIHCSGIHTIEKWVKNYRKHPAGWAALLMIHGIPEVTGRLRSKVENYAIYSALFLSVSIGLLTDPPSWAAKPCEDDIWSKTEWECELRKRLYTYLLAIGTATHMLSIMLGMGFINALNEAARDSDIYRMFARGKGFIATVKCEKAFGLGCLTDFAAMVVSVQCHMGWDALPLTVVMVVACVYVYKKTTGLLFSNASLVNYWRTELGGKPDKDDPYDLEVPISCFNEIAKVNKELFVENGILSGSKKEETGDRVSKVWNKLREESSGEDGDHHHHDHPVVDRRAEVARAREHGAVAALF